MINHQYGQDMNPKFPVYIISKGRWEARLTVKALEWVYHII